METALTRVCMYLGTEMQIHRRSEIFACRIVNQSQNVIASNVIDRFLAILPRSLDRAITLYNFIGKVRFSCVRATITIVRILQHM